MNQDPYRPPTEVSSAAYEKPFSAPVLLAFSDLSIGFVSIAAGTTFTLAHFRHFIGKPNEALGVALTLVLVGITLLSIPYFCIDFPLGIVERGLTHTLVVLLYNLAFAGASWFLWFRARRPGRYRYQVIFGLLLFIWLFWCSLPYLGYA